LIEWKSDLFVFVQAMEMNILRKQVRGQITEIRCGRHACSFLRGMAKLYLDQPVVPLEVAFLLRSEVKADLRLATEEVVIVCTEGQGKQEELTTT
jgi:hypothetical protein